MSRVNNLEHVYVVVCNGISDIGKGWLAASIAGLDPANTLIIKIDPLLNLEFPSHLGVPIKDICSPQDVADFIALGRAKSENYKISEDFRTYKAAGVKVFPECNIVAGALLKRFLDRPDEFVRQESRGDAQDEVKKRTFPDVSQFLAQEITRIAKNRKPKILIIEVGGTIEDGELLYIPGAFRLLGGSSYLRITPEIVLLSYFEYADSYDHKKYRVKTQHIRRGIIGTFKTYYNLPLKACFARRRNVPSSESDTALRKDLINVAHETQVSPSRIIYLPNVAKNSSLAANLQDITKLIHATNLF